MTVGKINAIATTNSGSCWPSFLHDWRLRLMSSSLKKVSGSFSQSKWVVFRCFLKRVVRQHLKKFHVRHTWTWFFYYINHVKRRLYRKDYYVNFCWFPLDGGIAFASTLCTKWLQYSKNRCWHFYQNALIIQQKTPEYAPIAIKNLAAFFTRSILIFAFISLRKKCPNTYQK